MGWERGQGLGVPWAQLNQLSPAQASARGAPPARPRATRLLPEHCLVLG